MTPAGSKRKRAANDDRTTATERPYHTPETTPDEEAPEATTLPLDHTPFQIEWVNSGKVAPAKRPKSGKASRDVAEPKEEPGIPEANLGGWYTVSPGSEWNSLRKYRNFVVNPNSEPKDDDKHKFEVGQYIFVNHSEIPQQVVDEKELWVALVREVRAEGQHAVFVRVLWLYWPEELPTGRESYHGERELVASNYQQIIDAMTVAGKAPVYHLKDPHEVAQLPEDSYYWRQTIDTRKRPNKSSTLPKECICNTPNNPDTRDVRCANESCHRWQHERCLLDATMTRYWQERGSLKKQDTRLPNGNTDGDEEMGDTIIASPKPKRTGIVGQASSIARSMLGKIMGGTHRSSGQTTDGKATKKLKRGRRMSKVDLLIDKARPWEDTLTAKLQYNGTESAASFNGKATIYRISENDGEQVLEDFDDMEAYCMFCGLSMAESEDVEDDEDDDEPMPDIGETKFLATDSDIKDDLLHPLSTKGKDYDAVRDAAASNAVSVEDDSVNGDGKKHAGAQSASPDLI